MFHSRFLKGIVVTVLAVFVVQLLGAVSPARAAWKSNPPPSDESSSTTTVLIIGAAVAVAIVVYLVVRNRGGDEEKDDDESLLRITPPGALALGGGRPADVEQTMSGPPRPPEINLILDYRTTNTNPYGGAVYAGLSLSF